MGQSNNFGSVSNDEIFNLPLGSGGSPASYKTPATFIDFICPNN